MKRIEITCRNLHNLIKENEDMFETFMEKPISDFTYDDFMYCLYYNSDNLLTGEIDDFIDVDNKDNEKQDFTG